MRFRKIYLLLIPLFVSFVAYGYSGEAWYVLYSEAVDLQEKDQWRDSVELLQQVIAAKKKPGIKLRTYGLHFIDYLPYFLRGMAQFKLGDYDEALRSFNLSESYAAIRKSSKYRVLLDLKSRISGGVKPPPEKPTPGDTSPKPVPEIPVDIPSQSSDRWLGGVPWYVTYELGTDYLDSGDWFGSIQNVSRAASQREKPGHYARTYGMWFIAYFPYYHLGLAHYNQSQWRLAAQYLKKSQKYGAIKHDSKRYLNLERLLSEIEFKGEDKPELSSPPELVERLVAKALIAGKRLFNLQRYDEAKGKFEFALKLDPVNLIAKNYLERIDSILSGQQSVHQNEKVTALYAIFKGQYDEAIQILKKAERFYKNDADYHAYLGVAYFNKYKASGNVDDDLYENVTVEFTKSVEINPDYDIPQVFENDVIELFNSIKQYLIQK